MEVVSLLIKNKCFRDFDTWPFNRVWPLNGGSLNRGSTVLSHDPRFPYYGAISQNISRCRHM